MARPLVEVCVESVDGAVAAQEGGADRVELCAGLVEGGTTPSAGAIAATRAAVDIGVVALVRPRGGDFLYSEREMDAMLRDVEAAREAGADGVATGALLADGAVDVARTRQLIEAARPMQVTFHRAFDVSRDSFESLQALIDLGADRVLSSGRNRTAPEGRGELASMVAFAQGRIAVIAASGVRAENVRELVAQTGVPEVHFSAGRVEPSAMQFQNPCCPMGTSAPLGDFQRRITDAEAVRRTVAALSG